MTPYTLQLRAHFADKPDVDIEHSVMLHDGDKASLMIVPGGDTYGRLIFETPDGGAISVHPSDWSVLKLVKV